MDDGGLNIDELLEDDRNDVLQHHRSLMMMITSIYNYRFC